MTPPNSQLGSVVSRLQGLKNVSNRRRVHPGSELLQNINDDIETDVSGTSQGVPMQSNVNENLPEQDLGGQLTPQSYDIRANSVTAPPETQEEPGFFSKLGQALADYVNPQKREENTRQVEGLSQQAKDMYEADPTNKFRVDQKTRQMALGDQKPRKDMTHQSPKAPETSSMGPIFDYFSPTKRGEMREYNKELQQNAQLASQGINPDEGKKQVHEGFEENILKAVENPGQFAVYGSANTVANSPVLKEQFKTITGIDHDEEIDLQVSEHEKAMQAVEDEFNGINTQLSSTEEGIKQRILNNQATDADKYYIGLALLMPLIVGGVFGKEAGLGALGGGAKGIAEVLGKRQEGIREDESSLLDISKQKTQNQEKLAGIGLEKAKLGPSLRKLLPEDPNKHLMGMKGIEFKNPQGETERGVMVLPGIVSKEEFVNTPEAMATQRKAAEELATVKSYVDDVDQIANDIIEISAQVKDPNLISMGFKQILLKQSPDALSKLSDDVDFEGRKQNAGILLKNKLGILANKYAQSQKMGHLDRATQDHMDKIMQNPTETFISGQDLIDQILQIKKVSQNSLLSQAQNKGFYSEFLADEMEKRNKKLFDSLNRKEQDKFNADLKRDARQNEMKYAK